MKPSVNRTSITKQVKNILMEQILTGRLKAGERIKTLHVAKELGVSQAPVREAIRWLEAGGYVHHKPNTGVRVRTFSIEELIEIYQVRELLESHAIKLAINSVKTSSEYEAHIVAMDSILNSMKTASKRKDAAAYAKHNTDFHRTIIEMAGNRVMLTTWESLEIQSKVQHAMLGADIAFDRSLCLHRPILSALKSRNETLGRQKISEHFDFICKYNNERVVESKNFV